MKFDHKIRSRTSLNLPVPSKFVRSSSEHDRKEGSELAQSVAVASSVTPLEIGARRRQNRPPEAAKSILGSVKIKPRSPRGVKARSRASQQRPRAPQERPKNAPRAAKSAPRAPQERPNSAQRGPETLSGTILRLWNWTKAPSESKLSRDSFE